jgi:hypothetical protein
LAGTMFQAKTGGTPDGSPSKGVEAPVARQTRGSDGPWLASCNYWSAARTSDTSGEKPPSPSEIVVAQSHGVKLQLDSAEDKATCGPDAWGVSEQSAEAPEISAIIATVPDPIHSHLALDFDRSIDAILLAAEDNHYLGSYYWLPWRSQISTSFAGESTSTATRPTDEDRARERQPGLIILRSNYRVIYLFLVAETPALGVNGDQLQNAFQYEKLLRGKYNATLSVCPWSPRLSNAAADTNQSAAGKQQTPRTTPRSDTRGNKRPAPGNQNVSSAGATKNQQDGATKSLQGKPCPKTGDKLTIIGPSYSGSASSLRAGIVAAFPDLSEGDVSMNGSTSTEIAVHELDPENKHIYRSFGENTSFERERFLKSLDAAGYDLSRVAVLSEAGTVFGSDFGPEPAFAKKGTSLYLRFPRELSLLRNAEPNQSSKPDSSGPPTPYLNLSLKDRTADDTVPRFSTNQSPLSIEAQLMAIAHQLQRARSQFIVISASNILDDIFLAQFLHRACPDARLVILSGGDLLFERDAENAQYIGSISISPYLLSSLDFGNRVQWLHANFEAEAIYNAASFAFWNSASTEPPLLAGYRNYPVPARSHDRNAPVPEAQFEQIPLWATVIGADGYYPLAVLDWCASDSLAILPTLSLVKGSRPVLEKCDENKATARDKRAPEPQNVWKYVPESINQNSGISPSLLWGVLASFIVLACIVHTAFLWAADLWSPLTRDLAIDQNDLPHRRSVYLNIGTSVLVAMAFVTAFPLILVGRFFHLADPGYVLAWVMIAAACLTGILTFAKTWRYCCPRQCHQYTFFNVMDAVALVTTIVFWTHICSSGNGDNNPTYVGLYFSYRCLRPLSGVCPLLPILLLLLAWYLWSIYQTARLRFSEIHRPRIARLFNEHERKLNSEQGSPPPIAYLPCHTPYPLFVPDDALDSCSGVTNYCLYKNITCLLITREVLYRFCSRLKDNSRRLGGRIAGWVQRHVDAFLLCIYLFLFCLCLFAIRIHSIERFLFAPFLVAGGPTRYEFLIMTLFFPLIMVALSGWLRAILIWGAISRGLLEPLERLPLRFAFSRFKAGNWMSILRQKGLHVRWRDMGRSTESIRQLVHHPDLLKNPPLHRRLSDQYEVINARMRELIESIKAVGAAVPGSLPATTTAAGPAVSPELAAALKRAQQLEDPCPSDLLWDLPKASADLCGIYRIEQGFAEFCRLLLDGLLIPHWEQERIGLVEECNLAKEESDKSTDLKSSEPSLIHAAEELIVVRYVALIRAVLINIRYLMLFVSAAFVLALIAWNSYPFQPHAFIDWCFTVLLAILTLGCVWVFAQMHRNAILSRLTDTTPNELGWEFYLRIVTFGAVPVLTWLAYQFPQIGGNLYKIIQPGLQVVK